MSRARRILLAVAFVLVIVGVAYFLYATFFAAPGGQPGVLGGANAPTGGLNLANIGGGALPVANLGAPGALVAGGGRPAEVASGGLTLSSTLVPTVVSNVQLASDGKSLYYYDQATGQFFKIDPATGVSVPLSSQLFPGVDKASWSPDGQAKSILEFPDGRKIFYDFNAQKQVSLPSHWEDFDWAPTGNEIVAKSMGADPNNRFLIVANPDGSNARPVEQLGTNGDLVDVSYSPNNQMVAMSRTGEAQALGQQQILPIGKNQENFRAFTVDGIGYKGLWSPDGARILYSASGQASDWKPALWSINGTGNNIGTDRKQIGLLTWADKCTFSGPSTAYCAAPRDLPQGAGFSRGVADGTPDDLYKVDLATGQYRLVASPDTDAAISKVIVSKDGSTLYYTELASGALKTIRLR